MKQSSNWVDSYGDALFNYALVRTSEREIAKDLVQDTFLSALESLKTFRGESSEKTWLFSILRNKIADYYRRRGIDKTIAVAPTEEDYFFDENGHWRSALFPTDWGAAPDEARTKDFLEVLRKCLHGLSSQCRSVFTLKYVEEMESDEVCKELAISPSNYWVIIHRAKLHLRNCLEKNWIKA